MTIEDKRATICQAAHRLAAAGLTTGTGGSFSIRLGDQVIITPTGYRIGSITPDHLVTVDLDGAVLTATPYRPTPALQMHLDIYRSTSAAAIAHAHPMSSVAVSNIVDVLPAVHYTAATVGGAIRVAPYAVLGSQELSDHVSTALHERTAVLLRNHGVVAVGSNIDVACDHVELVEWLAEVYLKSLAVAQPAALDANQITEVVATAARLHYTPFPGRER